MLALYLEWYTYTNNNYRSFGGIAETAGMTASWSYFAEISWRWRLSASAPSSLKLWRGFSQGYGAARRKDGGGTT
jgi:hypothetical protein